MMAVMVMLVVFRGSTGFDSSDDGDFGEESEEDGV